jgi:hypothetical protein
VTIALFIAKWLPHFLIYLIDTSIWYALWAALTGGLVGASDKLGMVRDFNGVRDAFMYVELACCFDSLPSANTASPSGQPV